MQKSDAYLNNINTGAELKIKQKTKKRFLFSMSYQVRCPTPGHLVGSEAACLVPVRTARRKRTESKYELRRKYPHFSCASGQKWTSVKLG